MEGGAASGVLALSEYAGVPLAETQKDLTPLQRMVVQKEAQRQYEEAQDGQDGHTSHGGHGGDMMNSHPKAGGAGNKMTGETVEYVNEGT